MLAIKETYTSNLAPTSYTVQEVVWQQAVYDHALHLAKRHCLTRLIDLGCGDGKHLKRFHDAGMIVIGLDTPEMIESHPHEWGTWVKGDLEQQQVFSGDWLKQSVVVCADVIEHLIDPMPLLKTIRNMLKEAPYAVISTPGRLRVYGYDHDGPPANPCHVREWTMDEFRLLLIQNDLLPSGMCYVRSNDIDPDENTILATIKGKR